MFNEPHARTMALTCQQPKTYMEHVFNDTIVRRNAPCIIAGFDQSHEAEGMDMLFTIVRHCSRRTRIILYNLGITADTLRVLSTNNAIEIYDLPAIVPAFARIFERGAKAFKPIVVADAMVTRGCLQKPACMLLRRYAQTKPSKRVIPSELFRLVHLTTNGHIQACTRFS